MVLAFRCVPSRLADVFKDTTLICIAEVEMIMEVAKEKPFIMGKIWNGGRVFEIL